MSDRFVRQVSRPLHRSATNSVACLGPLRVIPSERFGLLKKLYM